MGLSERTVTKLRAETEELGGKVYKDDEDSTEEDVTHTQEDDDPTKFAGEEVEESDDVALENVAPVGEVPDDQRGEAR